MPTRDMHTHIRHTYCGIDLSFGATVKTGCDKRRPKDRTTTDIAAVNCMFCRDWWRTDQLRMASDAEACANLAEDKPELAQGMTPEDFRTLAHTHRRNVARAGMHVG